MCAYSSCKAETPFQQWRWTTSVVCSSGTTAEQVCPIPITTRKLEFGPRWDSPAHTSTRKMDQHLHVAWNFKHSHQKYHCYKQKSKGWIVTNDRWTPKHVETPPFTQTVHHWASCVTRAGVVATLHSHFNDLVLVLWHHYAHTVFACPVVSLFYSYPSWPQKQAILGRKTDEGIHMPIHSLSLLILGCILLYMFQPTQYSISFY